MSGVRLQVFSPTLKSIRHDLLSCFIDVLYILYSALKKNYKMRPNLRWVLFSAQPILLADPRSIPNPYVRNFSRKSWDFSRILENHCRLFLENSFASICANIPENSQDQYLSAMILCLCQIHSQSRFTGWHEMTCPFATKMGPIDLVTVFDAILTSRQTREKLQCLYENLMSNNFCRTAVLTKIWFVN